MQEVNLEDALQKKLDKMLSDLEHKMNELSDEEFDSLRGEINDLNDALNLKGIEE